MRSSFLALDIGSFSRGARDLSSMRRRTPLPLATRHHHVLLSRITSVAALSSRRPRNTG